MTMATAYEWAKRLLVLGLLIGLLLFGWHAQRPARELLWNTAAASANSRDASAELKAAAGDVRAALAGKHGLKQLLYNANVVTAQIGRTSNQIRLASMEERQQAKQAGEKLVATVGELHQLVADTNESLNGDDGVLSVLASDLEKTGAALDQVGGEDGLVATGTKSLKAAGDVIAGLDPELKRAAKNVGDLTGHASGAVANLEDTTGYIKAAFAPKKVGFWGRMANAVFPAFLRQVLSAVFPERVKVVNEVQTKESK